jgi:leucyl aminopeptidase (aminopeptidase T)
MLGNAKKLAGARKIVVDCARLKPGEKVLVVTDTKTLRVGEIIATAALAVTDEVILAVCAPRRGHGDEPPARIATIMNLSDVVFAPMEYSMFHSSATRVAREKGARVVSMGNFEERMLERGGIEADFLSIAETVHRVAACLRKGNTATVATGLGTNLRMDISGRNGFAETGFSHTPGSISGPPNIEANVGPVEGTSEGVLIVDGSIPHPELGVLEEPVQLKIAAGRVVEVTGGAQARILRVVLEEVRDPAIYNVAELGIGLNPCSKISGNMLEDEGASGTCHIGIGNNLGFGGHVAAKSHFDMIIRNPTIAVDGQLLLREGALAI